jgi:peptide/nickel transport system substrate-binding protein
LIPTRCVKAAAFAAALAFCASGGAAAQGTRHPWTIPHVLRYATAQDISSLNPHLEQQLTLAYMSSLTMAWLTKTDEHNRAVPELITAIPTQANGGISKDGKTITYRLRRGVKWSDGAPFDADDVVFSIGVVLNPANNEVSRDGWDLIAKVDEPDKYTVVLHMKQPLAGFEYEFFGSAGANPCVLPKHLLARYPSINDVPYNALPVGIGPFKYASWKRGESVEMVRNQFYFRGQPRLERVIFKIIPDRNTVLTQLQTHEIDMWAAASANFVPRIRSISGITIRSQPSYFFGHLDFNVQRPAMADPAVRSALRLATDRKTLLDKIAHGLGILSESMISPANPYRHEVPFVAFDLAKANKTLDSAGWKRGPDGIRVKNGVKLDLLFVSSTGSPDIDSEIELIRAWWKQIGVAIDVQRYPAPLYFGPYKSGGIVYNGKWDISIFSWGGDPIADLSNLYECKNIPPNGQNDVRYCNKAVDAAMERFKRLYEAKARQPLIDFEVDQITRDVPTVVLSIPEDRYAFNSDLTGFRPHQLGPFDDFLNVDI